MEKLFGTDGIRGVANKYPLTIDMCIKLTGALVEKFKMKEHDLVIIGKDTRISGDMFEHALAAAFCAHGIDVKLLGVVPAPSVSILVKQLKASSGIMISASHNPFYDNGIKIFDADGLKLPDEDEIKIENLIEQHVSSKYSESFGRVERDFSALNLYREKILNAFQFNREETSKLKIVSDCSNGSFSDIAPEIFRKFGFNVISIADTPSGTNINEKCGVTNPQNISSAVLKNNADFGIAFDGDGDRVTLCDENGEIADGNHIIAALAESASLKEGSEVVSTIMANYGLEKYLNDKKIKLIRTKVGDRYLSEYMRKSEATIGGEPSGHVIVREHALTGDGLFTALKVIDYLIKTKQKCSRLRKIFDLFPSILENVKTNDKSIINEKHVADLIQKFQNSLKGRGKLIIRPSGTEPLIRISAEGQNIDELREIVKTISNGIEMSLKQQ